MTISLTLDCSEIEMNALRKYAYINARGCKCDNVNLATIFRQIEVEIQKSRAVQRATDAANILATKP